MYSPQNDPSGIKVLICFSIYVLFLLPYLQSAASPIIDFKWKVSHCACRGWRGKRLKWFLCVSRLSKAFQAGFYSWR